MTPEWRNASSGGDLERVRALLDAGADIDALDEHGQTALMNAARRGDAQMVELLIQRAAGLNYTAKYRLTALMLAVINRHAQVVRLLVAAGADRTIRGSQGSFARTPLDYALYCGEAEIAEILREQR